MVRGLFTVLAAVLCSGAVAQAGPITYSLTATASGTLGGSSFTNALVTVTLSGDTANVVPGPAPYTDIVTNSGTATVSVAGLGIGIFTDTIVILSTLNDPALNTFFGAPTGLILDNTTGTGILLQTGAIFSTYDLRSSLGPIPGTGGRRERIPDHTGFSNNRGRPDLGHWPTFGHFDFHCGYCGRPGTRLVDPCRLRAGSSVWARPIQAAHALNRGCNSER